MSTLTAFTDMAPVPRVLVDVPTSEFPVGSVTVSLQRTSDGRTMDVRGGQRLPASSPVIVLDPEPGFNVESVYTVLGFDAGGNVVGSWPVGSITLEFEGAVIQQPLDPRLSVAVARLSGTAATIRRQAPGSPAYPQGRVLPSLVGLGPRRGIDSMRLEVMVTSHADADVLQASLGTYETPQLPIWLVRTSDQRIPRVFFCHVPELVESSVVAGVPSEVVTFSAEVTEVSPPAAGITATGLTYSDVAVFFSTYSAVAAAYATYSDVKRDTSMIGAADA